jgi:hypothetical protein
MALDQETVGAMEDAIEQLDTDGCDCNMETCTDANPQCGGRKQMMAARRLRELLEPTYTGLHPERIRTGPAERAYVERWQRENIRQRGVNSGMTLLEGILKPGGQQWVDRPSQRDADVATTVIQWLGTNVGRAFVDEVERDISQNQALRRKLDHQLVDQRRMDPTQLGQYQAVADIILGRLQGTVAVGMLRDLQQQIVAAMQFAAAVK